MTKKKSEFKPTGGVDLNIDFSDLLSEWDKLKQKGAAHYKNGKIEPIDLIRDLGLLEAFARGNIIKYAARLKGVEDCQKIIHYAEMLKASMSEPLHAKDIKGDV